MLLTRTSHRPAAGAHGSAHASARPSAAARRRSDEWIGNRNAMGVMVSGGAGRGPPPTLSASLARTVGRRGHRSPRPSARPGAYAP